jgi:hypothetical protein
MPTENEPDTGRLHTNSNAVKPETFRLPKPGERDPHFGLPRTAYYELEATGAIKLIRLRKRGNTRGIVLIPFDQVKDYLFRGHNGPAEIALQGV